MNKSFNDDNFFQKFKNEVEQSYNDEKKKLEKEDTSLQDKVIEGTADGLVQGLLNPIRWARKLLG